MADVTLLLSKPRNHDPDEQPAPREAIIAKTESDPSNGLMVTIPSFHPHHMFGPCPWEPLVTATGYATPVKGDRALVLISEENNPWVLMWWPKEYQSIG